MNGIILCITNRCPNSYSAKCEGQFSMGSCTASFRAVGVVGSTPQGSSVSLVGLPSHLILPAGKRASRLPTVGDWANPTWASALAGFLLEPQASHQDDKDTGRRCTQCCTLICRKVLRGPGLRRQFGSGGWTVSTTGRVRQWPCPQIGAEPEQQGAGLSQ